MQQEAQNGALALEKPALRDEPIGIRAAAAALDVNASTISRQVKAGVIPNRGTEKHPKVFLREARAARAGNLDPAQQRETAPATQPPPTTGFQAHRSSHEAAKAAMAQIELAEKLGGILDRGDVESSVEAFGRKLRDALTERWRALSLKLQGQSPADIERLGIEADEDLLNRVSAELEAEIADAAASA